MNWLARGVSVAANPQENDAYVVGGVDDFKKYDL